MYKTILEKMIGINKEITAINRIRFSPDIKYNKALELNNKVKSLLNKHNFYRHILKVGK